MIYVGSKSKLTKELLPIILKDRKEGQWYVEPFAGGMNMISEVSGNRIANDLHTPLIEMWKALIEGWRPGGVYTREEYNYIKDNREEFPEHELGWVGFTCSFKGIYMGGFADESVTRDKVIRNYQIELANNILNHIPKMKDVVFCNKSYNELEIPEGSIIYCDPPYIGTKEYDGSSFNHEKFWDWVRFKDNEGHNIFVSEYTAPKDFRVVWEKDLITTLSNSSQNRTEKLFKYGEFSWM
jgi:DNA adenine methylase